MDESIDLTSNRIFRDRTPIATNASETLSMKYTPFGFVSDYFLKSKTPWDKKVERYKSQNTKFNNSSVDANIYTDGESVLMLGERNQETYGKMLKFYELDEGKRCFCCGHQLNILNGSKNIGICDRCDVDFENKLGKYFPQ